MRKKYVACFACGVVGLFLLVGCTRYRSIEVSYLSDITRVPTAEMQKVTVGVAKFDDKRPWVNKDDHKSSSYIAFQLGWKFGMTYQAKDYIPVNDLVQNLFVEELAKAGVNAKPIDQVLSKQQKQQVGKLGEQHKADYILGGEILAFEFVNETGFVTTTSRRMVTLSLILARVKDEEMLIDTVFNETQRDGEGMDHSTNIDKLMNRVFKKVAREVIQQIATKIGVDAKNVSLGVVNK